MINKRGQSATLAAVFVLVICVLIIFYILFLTPEDRAELLGEEYSGSSSGTSSSDGSSSSGNLNEVLLSEHIGRLDYLKTDTIEQSMPSFRIATFTEPEEIKTISSIYVQNGVMDQEFHNFTFTIDEGLTEDLLLSFNIKKAEGRLIIYLNGHIIENNEMSVGSPAPIELPEDYLKEKNQIDIAVSGVGWAFWSYNEYILENIKITAQVTDVSGSSGAQRFHIDEEEYNNIDEIKVRFYPECAIDQVGPLVIRVNGVKIYSTIGDCGIYNVLQIGKDAVIPGENSITFSTDQGSYLIDNIKIIMELEELIYPVYYFEMDDDYFTQETDEDDAECGKIDGVCPDDCDEDEDKDCCFENSDNYWCDLEPSNADDRCVSSVDENDCNRCKTGYEDDDGAPPEECEDLCGDDTDDDCPIGCSMHYDQDCCWELDEDNYWCDDVPIDGITSVCEEGIDTSECDDCPSGYEDESGDSPDCPSTSNDDFEDELRSKYKVTLKITFANTDDKKADVNVNGHIVRLDTNKLEWEYNINAYVRPDTNSIELIPKSTMEIATMEVWIED